LLLSDTRVTLRSAKLGEEIARNLGRRDAEFVKRQAKAVERNANYSRCIGEHESFGERSNIVVTF